MVQRLVPSEDIRIGNWTTHTGGVTNLYATIDEVTASTTDYVQSPDNPNNSSYVVGLREVTNPKTNQGHIVQWMHRNTGTAQITEVVELREGYRSDSNRGTVIADWNVNAVPSAFTTELKVIPTWEAADITDYEDLSLRFYLNQTGTGTTSAVQIAWVHAEVPDVVVPSAHRWKLIDISTAQPWDEWEFPINPLEFDLPNRTARIQNETSLAPDGGIVLFQGRDQARTGSFAGIINSRYMHNSLRKWLNKWHPLRLETDNDFSYNILVTRYEMERVRRAINQHRYDYSVEVTFL